MIKLLEGFRPQEAGESDFAYFKNALTKKAKQLGLTEFGNAVQSLVSRLINFAKTFGAGPVAFLKKAYASALKLMQKKEAIPQSASVIASASNL